MVMDKNMICSYCHYLILGLNSLLFGEDRKWGCKFKLQRQTSVETKMDGIKVKQNVNNIYFEPLSDTKEQNKLNMIFIGLSYITVRSCSSTFCQAINLLSKQARQEERQKEREPSSFRSVLPNLDIYIFAD